MKTALLAIAGVIVVAGICVGGWFGYWALAEAGQSAQYQVNTSSQQYQGSLVSQERDRVQGYDAAAAGPQQSQIGATFCATYLTLTQPPADLALASARICTK